LSRGHSFEIQVANAFKHKGFDIEVTPKSRDHGIDILMSKHGKLTGVECKCFARKYKVGREIIQKFDSALNHNPYSHKPLDYGYIVTTSSFTAGAYELVDLMNKHYGYERIKLIDGIALRRMTGGYSYKIRSPISQMSLKSKLTFVLIAVILIMCIMNGIADALKLVLSFLWDFMQ
jgi:restriction endonuclease Mrr